MSQTFSKAYIQMTQDLMESLYKFFKDELPEHPELVLSLEDGSDNQLIVFSENRKKLIDVDSLPSTPPQEDPDSPLYDPDYDEFDDSDDDPGV